MKRKFVVAMLAVVVSGTMVSVQPTAAQGSCQAFGADTAGFATSLGRNFGQATKANPDVSGFVAGLHDLLCEDNPAE